MKNQPMFSCQVAECAAEVSYPADQLAMYLGEPICAECHLQIWTRGALGDLPGFGDLPAFVPAFETDIAKLKKAVEAIIEKCEESHSEPARLAEVLRIAEAALE